MKIYDTDPEVYARSTKVDPLRTKSEIDGVLARFGIRDVAWRFDLQKDKKGLWTSPSNDLFIRFVLPPERFQQELPVQLEPPRIWHKTKKGDHVNWKASMRNLYWYILTHLSQAYVMESSKVTEFLPHILNRDGRKIMQVVEEDMLALPHVDAMKNVTPKVTL